MNDVQGLESRIDAEFKTSQEKLKQLQTQNVEVHRGRQERLALFAKACETLQLVWRPRLDALAKRFAKTAKVTPNVTPSLREATFEFRSDLASIRLRFSASSDEDVRNLVLDYDLHIIPILMKFEPHARTEVPLDAVDSKAVAKWIDDRILDFVRTYLSLHENEYYLKPQMVTDPIAGIEFPKSAAAATFEREGKTYYFISEETRREFEKNQGPEKKPAEGAEKAAGKGPAAVPEKAAAKRPETGTGKGAAQGAPKGVAKV